MKAEEERYLDRLIVTYIDQNIGETVLRGPDKAASFLRTLGWGHRKDYIEDTLNAYLADKIKGDGEVYVFTPSDGLQYEKKGKAIHYRGTTLPVDDDGKTFRKTINHIKDEIVKPTGQGSIRAFFYDQKTREAFERELIRFALVSRSEFLEVTEYKHKGVTMFTYTITQSLPPPGR